MIDRRTLIATSASAVLASAFSDRALSSRYAFLAPAKTPPEIIRKLHANTITALNDPGTRKRLEGLGVVVVGSTPPSSPPISRTKWTSGVL